MPREREGYNRTLAGACQREIVASPSHHKVAIFQVKACLSLGRTVRPGDVPARDDGGANGAPVLRACLPRGKMTADTKRAGGHRCRPAPSSPCWRRAGDSNPRRDFMAPYSLSRRAPSASRSALRTSDKNSALSPVRQQEVQTISKSCAKTTRATQGRAPCRERYPA